MIKQKTWILVTGNTGKAEEFQQLLNPFGIKIKTLKDIGFTDTIEETGASFEENAKIKVEALAKSTDIPVLADDSGLEVECLNGAPGIYSARYAGEIATDGSNRTKLLSEMGSRENRAAQFVCVLGLQIPVLGYRSFRGVCRGFIAKSEKGSNGFGYDPLFIPKGYSQSFGELDSGIKKKISHRAEAVKKMLIAL